MSPPTRTLPLVGCYTNACNLRNKWEDLNVAAIGSAFVAVTETWLKADCDCSPLTPDGMTMYRIDRPGSTRGGGVALLIRGDIDHARGESLCSVGIQAMEICLNTSAWNGSLINVYRSPCASGEESALLVNWLGTRMRSAPNFIIMGISIHHKLIG